MTNDWYEYTSYRFDGVTSGVVAPVHGPPLMLAPNPSGGVFSVAGPDDQDLSEVLVLDALGRLVHRYADVRAGEELRLDAPGGRYLVVAPGAGGALRTAQLLVE